MTWQTVKRLLWSAAGGAVAWWIVLSVVLGWMPPWSAAKQAGEQADAAVLHALAPICVARFEQDGDRAQKLEALKHASPCCTSCEPILPTRAESVRKP